MRLIADHLYGGDDAHAPGGRRNARLVMDEDDGHDRQQAD
jgi:RNA polymerase sigma-70 factor (ECF subfamily)